MVDRGSGDDRTNCLCLRKLLRIISFVTVFCGLFGIKWDYINKDKKENTLCLFYKYIIYDWSRSGLGVNVFNSDYEVLDLISGLIKIINKIFTRLFQKLKITIAGWNLIENWWTFYFFVFTFNIITAHLVMFYFS